MLKYIIYGLSYVKEKTYYLYNYVNSMNTSSCIAIAKFSGYCMMAELLNILGIPEKGLLALSVLMVIDIITGVSKQFIVNKSSITSHNFWVGIVKKLITLLLVIALGLMFFGTGLDGRTYITSVIGAFIAGETYSIIGNVYTVRTGLILPEYDVISIFIKTIGNTIKSTLEKTLSKK